ncbi:DUF1345 domain-containing protein [Actinoplanes sp. NPDC000266]
MRGSARRRSSPAGEHLRIAAVDIDVGKKISLVVSRVIETGLIILGISIILSDTNKMDDPLFWWDNLAVIYLLIRITRLRRSKSAERTEWLDHGLGGPAGLIFTVFTSVVGILAGLSIAMAEDPAVRYDLSFTGLPTVLFAWAILHFGYAERYARTYYSRTSGRPLSFPETDRPTFIDFAYFSFTLGTTFSVSDVDTLTSKIRLQILSHSILSFIYNTATIGIAVSVITG